MNEMYSRIENLCRNKKVNVTQMCREAEIPRGNLTDLKNGRTSELSTKNLWKIATYFGVSMDYLLGNEQEKATATEGGRNVTHEDLKIALFGGDGEVTDEMWEEAIFAAQLIKDRHNRKKDKND